MTGMENPDKVKNLKVKTSTWYRNGKVICNLKTNVYTFFSFIVHLFIDAYLPFSSKK